MRTTRMQPVRKCAKARSVRKCARRTACPDRCSGASQHGVRAHRISLVYSKDVVAALHAVRAAGAAVHGEALHVAQREAPTIAEHVPPRAALVETSAPALP